MLTFVARRVALGGLTLVGVSLVVFALVHLAGDPVRLMFAESEATPEDIARLRHELGYDAPVPVQLAWFVGRAVRGDLGTSVRFRQPAIDLVLERVPATFELAVAAMAVALGVAVPLGVTAAVRRGTLVDRGGMIVALVGQSIPLFWLAISLVLVFAVTLQWLPAAGRGSFVQLVLPALTLASYPMARTARLMRSTMLEVLGCDYVRTARAKGVVETVVRYKHALRNALLPVVTLVALQFGTLLGGAVVTEAIFAWPGLGQLALQAVLTRDLPLVQAVVLVTATIFVAINTSVDVLYGCLDPRVRIR